MCKTFYVMYAFISLGSVPRSGIAGSYGNNLCLTFWGTARLFSKVTALFYNPISCEWGFQLFHILLNTYCLSLLLQTSRWVWNDISCGFDLHSLSSLFSSFVLILWLQQCFDSIHYSYGSFTVSHPFQGSAHFLPHPSFFFFFNIYLSIYLAALGLSCSTRDL